MLATILNISVVMKFLKREKLYDIFLWAKHLTTFNIVTKVLHYSFQFAIFPIPGLVMLLLLFLSLQLYFFPSNFISIISVVVFQRCSQVSVLNRQAKSFLCGCKICCWTDHFNVLSLYLRKHRVLSPVFTLGLTFIYLRFFFYLI